MVKGSDQTGTHWQLTGAALASVSHTVSRAPAPEPGAPLRIDSLSMPPPRACSDTRAALPEWKLSRKTAASPPASVPLR